MILSNFIKKTYPVVIEIAIWFTFIVGVIAFAAGGYEEEGVFGAIVAVLFFIPIWFIAVNVVVGAILTLIDIRDSVKK